MAKAGTGTNKENLIASLGLDMDSNGDVDDATMATHFRVFNWQNEVAQSILQDSMKIPDEVQNQIDAILNDPDIQTLEETMKKLDAIDPLAIPDEWWDNLSDFISKFPEPTFKACD